jgi:hypothetical protein
VSQEDFANTLGTINGFFFDSENLTAAQCLERYLGMARSSWSSR